LVVCHLLMASDLFEVIEGAAYPLYHRFIFGEVTKSVRGMPWH
jgi:hypothetical protein